MVTDITSPEVAQKIVDKKGKKLGFPDLKMTLQSFHMTFC